jgi:hypothetical protein
MAGATELSRPLVLANLADEWITVIVRARISRLKYTGWQDHFGRNAQRRAARKGAIRSPIHSLFRRSRR